MNYLTCDAESLALFLSNADMAAFGIDYEALDYSNELARKMLRFYIELAKAETGFAEIHPTLLECIPQKNGGCIVKITNSTCADVSAFYVASGDFTALLLFAKAISNKYGHIKFTLWHTEHGTSISFGELCSDSELASLRLVCKEFCDLHIYTSADFSVFTEHATRLYTCNAAFLATLT